MVVTALPEQAEIPSLQSDGQLRFLPRPGVLPHPGAQCLVLGKTSCITAQRCEMISFGCSPEPTRFPVQSSPVGGTCEQLGQGQEELLRSILQ